MTAKTDELAFEWSVGTADGSPPAELRGLSTRSTTATVPSTPDIEAVELLRAAGLQFDQEGLSPRPNDHQLIVSGSSDPAELAAAIVAAVRDRNATVAVDATSTPLRVFDVVSTSTALLVISTATAARQVPAEESVVEDAIQQAIEAASAGAATPPSARGRPARVNPTGEPEPVAAEGELDSPAYHSDEMVMQEPARQRAMVKDLLESGEAGLSRNAIDQATHGPRRLLRRGRITAGVLPLSIGGAVIGARYFGAPRRWIVGAVAMLFGAVALDALRHRRKASAAALGAERQAQTELDSESGQMERGEYPDHVEAGPA